MKIQCLLNRRFDLLFFKILAFHYIIIQTFPFLPLENMFERKKKTKNKNTHHDDTLFETPKHTLGEQIPKNLRYSICMSSETFHEKEKRLSIEHSLLPLPQTFQESKYHECFLC